MHYSLVAMVIAITPVALETQVVQAPALSSPAQAELQRQRQALQGVDAEIARLRRNANPSGDLSQRDLRRLQQLMEQKTSLEQQISDTMRGGYEGGQATLNGLKPS